MANINVEAKTPIGEQIKESLVAAGVSGYSRGLAVTYGTDMFHAALVTVAAIAALGILEEDQEVPPGATAPSMAMAVIEFGMAVAQIGANVAPGQQLATNAAGQLVPAQPGQPVVAISLETQNYVAPGSFACVLVVASLGITMQGDQVNYITATGAIPLVSGVYVLNGAAALEMTLATPTAAQDGTKLVLVAGTSHAHTVTAAVDTIEGTKDTITYAAAYDICVLEAVNLKWAVLSIGGPTPAALSEV
jgi:hypothetical protein